jgi:hypothetical protein
MVLSFSRPINLIPLFEIIVSVADRQGARNIMSATHSSPGTFQATVRVFRFPVGWAILSCLDLYGPHVAPLSYSYAAYQGFELSQFPSPPPMCNTTLDLAIDAVLHANQPLSSITVFRAYCAAAGYAHMPGSPEMIQAALGAFERALDKHAVVRANSERVAALATEHWSGKHGGEWKHCTGCGCLCPIHHVVARVGEVKHRTGNRGEYWLIVLPRYHQ